MSFWSNQLITSCWLLASCYPAHPECMKKNKRVRYHPSFNDGISMFSAFRFFWKRPTPDFQSGAQYLPASVGWVGDLWETSWMGSLVLTNLLVKLGDVRMITYIRIYIYYTCIYIIYV
jgi:hypothetical protein